jgi:protein-S-isoprenylcysteine O-methyltransferase Ste14
MLTVMGNKTYIYFMALEGLVLLIVPLKLAWRGIDLPMRLGDEQWLGMILIAAGVALLFSAHKLIYRGSQWSKNSNLVSAPRRLVTQGPYRVVRHPILDGAYLIVLGEAIFFVSSAVFVWFLLTVLISVTFAITIEEDNLNGKFGRAYRRYKSRTPGFIPDLFERSRGPQRKYKYGYSS